MTKKIIILMLVVFMGVSVDLQAEDAPKYGTVREYFDSGFLKSFVTFLYSIRSMMKKK